ncbi:hypothetical protein Q765_03205 [Flavobacterium rivuli WB 3.3-2 = DSM 21788]|uniref:Uncharacterized protein n=2 Tax=Flavobacterium rivuli TaxID=498301 RepID=A0A0A2M9G7_9FLAO|nr:hypothetical protein Q765_03205 [Flavobacterium rivuli WB 3.3-2 = DSM 21788]
MVFLFPGILFRKFYYTGKFSNQFNHGNLLERFLWILFLSIVSLVLSGFIIYYATDYFSVEFIHNIDFRTVSKIFESLATNKYPDAFTNEVQLTSIGAVVLLIWILSAISGLFSYYFVTLFNLDHVFSALRFNNDWHYIGIASKENGINRKWGDNFRTYLDVLSSKKDKEELYRGRLKQFVLDKDNKIEHIVIESPLKFISFDKTPENQIKIDALHEACVSTPSFVVHKEFIDKIVFKKEIEGKIFVLPYENVVNINITYLKISNSFFHVKLAIVRFTLIFFYIILLGLAIFPMVKVPIKYFDTFLERAFFTIVSIFILTIFLDLFKSFFQVKSVFYKKLKENIIFAAMFSTLYLYVFEFANGWVTAVVFFIAFICAGVFLQQKK